MRSRLGIFLYAPRVGGAERYVKDLLHGIDRDHFEVVMLYGAWAALDQFLELDAADVEVRPLRLAEPGAQLSAAVVPGSGALSTAAHGEEVPASAVRRLVNGLPAGSSLATIARNGLRLPAWLRNVQLLRTQITAARLDLLHIVNGGYPGAVSAQAAAISGDVPHRLMTVCSTAMPRQVPPLDAMIDRRVSAALDAVIVPGETPGRALVERRSFDPAKLVSIPWGVSSQPPPRRTNRDRVRVGTLANFTGAKGHGLLLEAFTAIMYRHPNVDLVLAGEGPVRAAMLDRAAALNLGDRVSFPGNVVDAIAFCRTLDLFVLASDIEGLPYVVLESLSQGLPVIATDVGAMAEAVVDGVNGRLIPPGDVSALTNALDAVLSDTVARRGMEAASLSAFDQRFALERMLERHQALYDRVLTGQQ